MRYLAIFALLVTLVSQQLPATAACDGDHYEYDHGECIDRTEDTTSVLTHAYHAGDNLQRGMADRARSDLRNSYGRRSEAPHLTPPDIRLSFSEDAPDIAPSILARQTHPHDRQQQREAERLNERLSAFYRRDMRRVGAPPAAIGTARWYFTVAAYRAFDGERLGDALDARVLLATLSFLITRSAILSFSQSDKRFYAERYAILGESFDRGYHEAAKQRNEADRNVLAHFARLYLKADLGVDPAVVPLGGISCRILPFPGLSCAQDRKRLRAIFR